MTTGRVVSDPLAVQRQNDLFDLYNQWDGEGDPDDDLAFVAAARNIMGLPQLEQPIMEPLRGFTPGLHPQYPKGTPGGKGGEFRPGLADALQELGIADRRELLHRAQSSGERDRSQLRGGEAAQTELVTFNDGTRAVHKRTHDSDAGSGREQADREELASLAAAAVGVKAPAVVRAGDDDVYMEYVDGDIGSTIDLGDGTEHNIIPVTDTWSAEYFGLPADFIGYAVVDAEGPIGHSTDLDEAQRILDAASRSLDETLRPTAFQQISAMEVFDDLIGNDDRHSGNWIVTPAGDVYGIDHGLAWGPTHPSEPDRNPFTPADMARIRKRMAALRPEFDRLGRGDWLDYTLERIDALEPTASGSKDLT